MKYDVKDIKLADKGKLRIEWANQSMPVQNSTSLENEVYGVPEEIDKELARLKLNAMGVRIDKLTPEQKKYLASWEMGT